MPEQEPTVISHRAPLSLPVLLDMGTPGHRLVPGMRLAQFELLQYVGGGGMGRVFRAMDAALVRTVAIKVLSRDQAADPETLARFRNEAQSAARLDHDNIVRVYHVGEEDGLPYIVFEFIEGVNIRTMVEQRGALPLAEAVSYTLQVAQALEHAARCNVVHRDIKPSNVLVTQEGCVKLIDMGLARLQKLSDSDPELTASGVTLGTFDYISPEQARDPRTADVRSDIYSLGCTLFYMLTARPPFPEGTVLQKLLQHQGDQPPDVQESRPELPDQVSRLVRKMIAKDPRRRFQTAAELIAGLSTMVDEIGLGPLGLGEKVLGRARPSRLSVLQRNLPWLAPAAILIAVILLLDRLVWSPPPARFESAGGPVAGRRDSPHPPLDKSTSAGQDSGTGRPTPEPAGAGKDAAPSGTPDSPGGTSPAPKPPEKAPSSGAPPASGGPSPGGAPPAPAPGVAKPAVAAVPDAGPAAGKALGGSLRVEALRAEIGGAEPAWLGRLAIAGTSPLQGELNGASVAGLAVPSPGAAPGERLLGRPGSGVLVVDGTGDESGRVFATLEQACSKAADGDVIELRYQGPRKESPLTIHNRKITIRAAEQYQPTVVFRPSELDPSKRAMVTLNGSQLTLINVSVELDVPREAQAESWSLFEIRQSKTVRLERCLLTIRNASEQQEAYQEVAFFRIKAPPGSGLVEPEPATAADRAALFLVDCILRGEATVLWVHDLRPAQLTWENGLLATTERLLVADGGERSPLPGESLKIELRHLTAVVRGGLCQFNQGETGPRQLPAQLTCADNIFVAGAAGPLVEQTGVPASDRPLERIEWNGEHNFYEGFAVFWSVERSDPELPTTAMDFDAWQSHWQLRRENSPAADQVRWKNRLPSASRPVHTHTPEDYALDASAGLPNPALTGASDGRGVGCRFDRLPQISATAPLPSPPSPPPPAKTDTPDPWTAERTQ